MNSAVRPIADLLAVLLVGVIAFSAIVIGASLAATFAFVAILVRLQPTVQSLAHQLTMLSKLRVSYDAVENMVRERLLWTLQDETLEQTDLIDAMVDFYSQSDAPLSGDLFARQCDACLAHDTVDRLREIRCPTLVMCGRQDLLTPPKFHRELADEIPDAHLVTLSYGAHLIMAESAERFNETVLRFLGSRH